MNYQQPSANEFLPKEWDSFGKQVGLWFGRLRNHARNGFQDGNTETLSNTFDIRVHPAEAQQMDYFVLIVVKDSKDRELERANPPASSWQPRGPNIAWYLIHIHCAITWIPWSWRGYAQSLWLSHEERSLPTQVILSTNRIRTCKNRLAMSQSKSFFASCHSLPC